MSSLIDHSKRQPPDEFDDRTVTKRSRDSQAEMRPESALYQLPEEISLLILDELLQSLLRSRISRDVSDYSKALHSLCLTNRKFNRLAKPYLHAIINDKNYDTIRQVLDAFALDSQMADGVKYVSFTHNTIRYEPHARRTLSTSAEKEYFKTLGKLGIPELAGELRQCVSRGIPEDHLATALVLARNLEYLEVTDMMLGPMFSTFGETSRPPWLELLSLSALSDPPGLSQHFQHLHHLRLSMEFVSFEQIGPLFRLPALRILYLHGGDHCGRLSAHPWDEEVSKRCSAIELLIVEGSSLDSRAMAQILDAICNLKVLKLEFDPLSLNDDDMLYSNRLEFQWSILGKAIAAHKDSLERLYLTHATIVSLWPAAYESDLHNADQDYLASLHDMQNLRYLDTGLRPFRKNPTGKCLEAASFHDTLPVSLEHLVIQVDDVQETLKDDSLQTSLLDLAANCKSKLPLLRDVVVWLPKFRENLDALDFAACKVAFERQCIDIRVLLCNQERWQLHPSTVENPSMLGKGGWGCQLLDPDNDYDPDHDYGPDHDYDPDHDYNPDLDYNPDFDYDSYIPRRVPVNFHGACSAYHDPSRWSIIDDFGRCRP